MDKESALEALRESPLDRCFFVAAMISKEPIDTYYAPCTVTRQRHEELKDKSNHDFVGTTSAIIEAQLSALTAAPATELVRCHDCGQIEADHPWGTVGTVFHCAEFQPANNLKDKSVGK